MVFTTYIADDDMALLHFKLRVLDLVDVLLRRESTNPIIFVSSVISLEYFQL